MLFLSLQTDKKDTWRQGYACLFWYTGTKIVILTQLRQRIPWCIAVYDSTIKRQRPQYCCPERKLFLRYTALTTDQIDVSYKVDVTRAGRRRKTADVPSFAPHPAYRARRCETRRTQTPTSPQNYKFYTPRKMSSLRASLPWQRETSSWRVSNLVMMT